MATNSFLDALTARFDGNKKKAAEALDLVLDTLSGELARGEKVVIRGFGTFQKVAAVPGDTAKRASAAVLEFSPSASLKAAVSSIPGLSSGRKAKANAQIDKAAAKVDAAEARTKAAADKARADIISGTVKVHDYMSDSKCTM